jgi:hypothetical protein
MLAVIVFLNTSISAQLFRPLSTGDHSAVLLKGNWQSCRESDGSYAERVYDGKWSGLPEFELHLGPYRQFALFKKIQDEHRDHDLPENLLKPHDFRQLTNSSARQVWDVEGLNIEVALSGGSRDDCESWYITLTRANPSSF